MSDREASGASCSVIYAALRVEAWTTVDAQTTQWMLKSLSGCSSPFYGCTNHLVHLMLKLFSGHSS